ncbi:hypothetical protein D3C74_436670 [compost metagenome]
MNLLVDRQLQIQAVLRLRIFLRRTRHQPAAGIGEIRNVPADPLQQLVIDGLDPGYSLVVDPREPQNMCGKIPIGIEPLAVFGNNDARQLQITNASGKLHRNFASAGLQSHRGFSLG